MVKLNNVSLTLGGRKIIDGFSAEFMPGTATALLGASGCGKTTLLRLIAGLERADKGEVIRDGKVSFAFQEPRLLPDRTALQNINFVLGDGDKTLDEAQKWLKRAELGQDGDKLPSELSGGMKQRISLVRALAFEADILLLDEPFAALDGALKQRMMELVKEYSKGKTVVFVTHDRSEAEYLSDRIIEMK